MSEVNSKVESKVEQKRLRGRNSHEVINQIVENFNSSNGWALKRVNMIGMNVEVYLERSSLQGYNKAKETPSAKQVKEEVTKTSEPQTESKEVVVDVKDAQSKPATSDKLSVKRGRATKK